MESKKNNVITIAYHLTCLINKDYFKSEKYVDFQSAWYRVYLILNYMRTNKIYYNLLHEKNVFIISATEEGLKKIQDAFSLERQN